MNSYNSTNRLQTDFLTYTPTRRTGFASIFNLFGDIGPFNMSRTPEEADGRALYCDFTMTFYDVSDAFVRILRDDPSLIDALAEHLAKDRAFMVRLMHAKKEEEAEETHPVFAGVSSYR